MTKRGRGHFDGWLTRCCVWFIPYEGSVAPAVASFLSTLQRDRIASIVRSGESPHNDAMPRDGTLDPFEQLERCHRRLEEACDALGRATETEDRATIEDVVGFLERQIRRHDDDEDASLFPRLKDEPELVEPLARLTAEHEKHVELRNQLKSAFEASDWATTRRIADEIVRAYREHIALEETTVFPLARTALNADDRAAMRKEMDARRGR